VLPVEGFPIVRRWFVVHRRHKRLSAAANTFHERMLVLGPAAVSDAMVAQRPA
jgi:LysR family transcriptional regulator, low CO2-responsive transcriptional regulator